MPLAPAHLVDADDEEPVETVRVEALGHDPFDDAPDGVPVDTHQPAQRGLVHGRGQPADQILEVAGEPRPGPGETDALGADTVVGAAKPAQIGAHVEPPVPEVEVPPARRDRPDVVAGPGGERALRAAQLPAPQPDGDDHPGLLEVHVGDGDPGQVQQALECGGDAHGSVSSARSAS